VVFVCLVYVVGLHGLMMARCVMFGEIVTSATVAVGVCAV
jgi:hypothetical protein